MMAPRTPAVPRLFVSLPLFALVHILAALFATSAQAQPHPVVDATGIRDNRTYSMSCPTSTSTR